jgi:hypothetical protein
VTGETRTPPRRAPGAGAAADRPRRRRLGAAVSCFLCLAAILAATLFPSAHEGATGWDGCLFCGSRGLADALLNVALFVPLGAALARLGVPARFALPLAALLSAGIETAQFFVPGRDPSPPDLLFNSAGAALGSLAGQHAARLLLPSGRGAARLSLAWSALFAAAVALTGWLTGPSFPRDTLYGQWTPEVGDMPVYDGRVLAARVGPAAVARGRLGDSRPVREALVAGAPVEAVVLVGPPHPALSPVLRIVDEEEREAVLLAAEGRDFVFGYRMRAENVRLDRPLFRVPDARRDIPAGDTIRVAVQRRGRGIAARVDGRLVGAPRLDVGRGWTLLFFSLSFGERTSRALDALWIALWTLPLGLWARRRARWYLAAGIAAAALVALPGMVALAPAGLEEVVGAAAGVAAGYIVRHRVERRREERRQPEAARSLPCAR